MKTFLTRTIGAAALAVAATAATADNIVEIAASDDRFSTLVTAVQAAGLAEALSGPGPFTVFAPVNDAFAALPEGTLESLLKAENKGQLTNILLYHVDDRKLTSKDIPAGKTPIKPMLTSDRLCVVKSGGAVMIDDGSGQMANVVIADIMADNGVIHVVDKVLLPSGKTGCH